MKRAIDIETLLTWAYCEELVKRDASAAEANWDHISEQGERGGMAIGGGATPQRYAAISAPHPDALIVNHQVNGLAERMGGRDQHVKIIYEGSWPVLFGDMPGMAPLTMSLPSFNIVAIIKSMAVLKRRPRWNVGIPRARRTLAHNGRTKIIGECFGRDRYSEGSFCPLEWEPTVHEFGQARAEYLIWHRALVEMADALTDSLVAHAPLRPAARQTPWNDASEAASGKGTIYHNPLVTPRVLAAVRARRGRRPASVV